MKLEPLGDAAYILRKPSIPAHILARALNRLQLKGLVEAVPSYDTVGIFVEPDLFSEAEFEGAIGKIYDEPVAEPRLLRIPVNFEMGEDLEMSALQLGLTKGELISMFCETVFTCYAIGFCPGFPYLGYLPPQLAKLNRLDAPRVRVPKGSVAITGDQAGIYTMERPGGWRILGRTPLELVCVEEDYFPIDPGDEVEFHPIDLEEYSCLEGKRL